MIQILHLTTPSYEQWAAAIMGMRNSYRSWDKSDTFYCYGAGLSFSEEDQDICRECTYSCLDNRNEDEPYYDCLYTNGIDGYGTTVLGKNDLNLLLALSKEGSSNRKILRQLPVTVQLRAPLYLWKQIDQYKIGTTTNSESTMHSIAAKEFTKDDFSMTVTETMFSDYYLTDEPVISILDNYGEIIEPIDYLVFMLNKYRNLYRKTKDDIYKTAMIELLPESYYQSRMWSLNYEVIVNIAKDRIDHDLDEWRELILYFIDNIPYIKEILNEIGIISLENIVENRTDFEIEQEIYPTHLEVIKYWSDKNERFEVLAKRYKKGGEGWSVHSA